MILQILLILVMFGIAYTTNHYNNLYNERNEND